MPNFSLRHKRIRSFGYCKSDCPSDRGYFLKNHCPFIYRYNLFIFTEGHVMISYQWDAQERMLKLRDELKRDGYNVWMDVEKMGREK